MFRTIIAAVLLCESLAQGQGSNPKLTFEADSIKPAAPEAMARMQGSVDGGPGTPDPGRIRFTDVPLRVLIMRAYDVQSFQVSGAAWMDSQRFDVIAKVPEGATREDARIMLQNLLAERFKLKLHKGSTVALTYELLVAKGGPRMKDATQTAAIPGENPGGSRPEPASRGKDGLLPESACAAAAKLRSKRRLHQCYAPRELGLATSQKKINEDFSEALPYWKEHFDEWIFTHNDFEGLPADLLKLLLDLTAASELVRALSWGYAELRDCEPVPR